MQDADTWFNRQQSRRRKCSSFKAMQKAKELHQEREGEKEEDADFKDDLMARAEVEVLKQNAAEF